MARPWPTPSHVPVRSWQELRSPRPRGRSTDGEPQDRSGYSPRSRALPPSYPRQNSPLPACGPWHSPDSLLMSLAGSLGAAGTLRLALCSFQYSRQCRSWEWMKRHMSQAWAAHTSSSTQSLQRSRAGDSVGAQATVQHRGGNRSETLPPPWPVTLGPGAPHPGRVQGSFSASLCSSTGVVTD